MQESISRMDLLRGGWKKGSVGVPSQEVSASKGQITVVGVRIDNSCLDVRGTTCRLCEDACGEFAIRFQMATRGRALPIIEEDLCTGCEDCLPVCPAGAIHPLYEIEDKKT